MIPCPRFLVAPLWNLLVWPLALSNASRAPGGGLPCFLPGPPLSWPTGEGSLQPVRTAGARGARSSVLDSEFFLNIVVKYA